MNHPGSPGEWTERTYAELLHRAAVLLAHGESVIADASFISAPQRLAAEGGLTRRLGSRVRRIPGAEAEVRGGLRSCEAGI
jgi:uncharacterized protein